PREPGRCHLHGLATGRVAVVPVGQLGAGPGTFLALRAVAQGLPAPERRGGRDSLSTRSMPCRSAATTGRVRPSERGPEAVPETRHGGIVPRIIDDGSPRLDAYATCREAGPGGRNGSDLRTGRPVARRAMHPTGDSSSTWRPGPPRGSDTGPCRRTGPPTCVSSASPAR